MLTRARITGVVLLGLYGGVSITSAQQPGAASQWDGVFTERQAERGRFAYAEHCASCHGADLRGLPQPVVYRGQSPLTPPLVGNMFSRNWDQLSFGDLHERIRISMPQQNPGSLGGGTVADILAFILQEGGYPSGASELPPLRADLATVQFLRIRP